MRRTQRRLWSAYAVAAALVVLPLAPAFADTTVTVRGTSFPTGPAAQLSFVGCADPYQRTAEQLHPYVGIGPATAPAGRRSLGYDLAGGDAVGSLHYVGSVAATTVAGMSVFAPEGASGVSYLGYQEPADRGTGLVWIGRAELTAPAGAWTRVDVPQLTFDWHQYDMVAMGAVDGPAADGGRAGVAAFLQAHGGDGPGFVTIGFGCDGRAFSMDAWRIGAPGSVTTYDLEGLATATSIDGPTAPVRPGERVTLHGTVTVEGGSLPAARLVLQRRGPDGWTIVDGVDATPGRPVELTVTPDETTTYRWELVDRPLAEGSTSAPFTVEVRQPAPSPGPSAGPTPTGPAARPSPRAGSTRPATGARPTSRARPTAAPTARPTTAPTTTPTTTTTATATAASGDPAASLSAPAGPTP